VLPLRGFLIIFLDARTSLTEARLGCSKRGVLPYRGQSEWPNYVNHDAPAVKFRTSLWDANDTMQHMGIHPIGPAITFFNGSPLLAHTLLQIRFIQDQPIQWAPEFRVVGPRPVLGRCLH